MSGHGPHGRRRSWSVDTRRCRAFLVCGVDDRPVVLPAAGPGGRGGWLRLHGRPRQHLLPRGLRHHLPVQPRRDPRVPRGQALPRAVLAHPGHGRGDRAHPLRHLRDQAAHPPAGPHHQAGELHRGADRTTGCCSASGTSPWPEDYEICGVPWERRGKRMDEEIAIMRGLMAGGFFEFHGEVFDVPVHQDVPDAEPARADPDRRAPRGRPPAGRRRRGRLAARRRRPGRPPGAADPPGRAAPGARHRHEAVRDRT